MENGGDEGVGDVLSGTLKFAGMGSEETDAGREKALCKMSNDCVEDSGMLRMRWLLPRLLVGAPRDER